MVENRLNIITYALSQGSGGKEPVIKPLNVSSNGTYEAPEGVDGYSPVNVNVSGGGGDIDAFIDGSIVDVVTNATNIRQSCFYNIGALRTITAKNVTTMAGSVFAQSGLVSFDLPNVQTMGSRVFFKTNIVEAYLPELQNIVSPSENFAVCPLLESINLPKLVGSLGNSACSTCSSLSFVNIPLVTELGTNCFYKCPELQVLDLPSVTNAENGCFRECSKLNTIILRSNTVCTYKSSSMEDPPLKNTTLRIYVPQALLASYQTATNWARLYAANPDIFQPIEGSEYE